MPHSKLRVTVLTIEREVIWWAGSGPRRMIVASATSYHTLEAIMSSNNFIDLIPYIVPMQSDALLLSLKQQPSPILLEITMSSTAPPQHRTDHSIH